MNHMPDDSRRVATSKFVAATNRGPSKPDVRRLSTITNHKVRAGQELTIDYGGGGGGGKAKAKKAPYYFYPMGVEVKTPGWHPQRLRVNGLCVDQIQVQTSTVRPFGREMLGAFSARRIERGGLVAPTPLLWIHDSSVLRESNKDNADDGKDYALIINYCFRVPGHDGALLFPYGPGVGYINHANEPNVALRWSGSSVHNPSALSETLERRQNNEHESLGPLILEVYALRDIAPGAELFLDYGSNWVQEWERVDPETHTEFRSAISLPQDLFPVVQSNAAVVE